MPIITVIGSTNTDLVVKVPRFPATGETIKGTNFQIFSGGKGANQAVAAARLGAQVNFITKIGNDNFGKRELANLKRNGINTDCVIIDEQHPTGVALIEVDDSGSNRIVVVPGANNHLTCEDIFPIKHVIENSDVVLVQLEIPLATVGYALALGAKSKAVVILNPAPADVIPADFYPNISIITPNETEAALLTKLQPEHVDRIAESFLKKGVNKIIITLGEKGAYFRNETESGEVAAFQVKPVDTTAAGDAFNAGLAVAIAEGLSLKNSILFANATAALSVTTLGAQSSMPNRAQVEKLLETKKS
ncbi:ribokinase [candidate division KSB1 bacterium]|nr:ribokinase [candidate division KSB1 bacterium]